MVDLSLSSEDIPELMLIQLLQAECKELLIQHLQFQNYKQELREKLATEEVTRPAFCIILMSSDLPCVKQNNTECKVV